MSGPASPKAEPVRVPTRPRKANTATGRVPYGVWRTSAQFFLNPPKPRRISTGSAHRRTGRRGRGRRRVDGRHASLSTLETAAPMATASFASLSPLAAFPKMRWPRPW